MNIKYVPVLRYISEERKALISISSLKKTIPLLELVRERPGQKRTGTFQDTYLEDFSRFKFPILIDIPAYMNINKGTRDGVRDFVDKFKQNIHLKVDYYKLLSINKNIIPVLSYMPKCVYVQGELKLDYLELKKSFNRVAFRIFNSKHLNAMLIDISKVITNNDILIYDLDKASPNDPQAAIIIRWVNKLKSTVKFTSIIIRSSINSEVKYKNLIDGRIVNEIDNSLLKDYVKLGFNAFGDFAGIRKDSTISKGGYAVVSPGFLQYSWHINSFIGYKARFDDYKEFINHIKPSITSSTYWKRYTDKHHKNCPGCLGLEAGSSTQYRDWKRYALQHYLYTMEEFL
ncbi:hypothetical protein IAI10_01710 [Clostridium sp. 19966]|uniref:beta family protein n=1 Tax=Clostridium sp. 19966 TaxID=2768166 RepID=UPI0028DE16EC|nr:hypothetical protein [Clostridium sp. 19966]MDT8715391.1 hypothetical protein [Clostridium sp. 19966]